ADRRAARRRARGVPPPLGRARQRPLRAPDPGGAARVRRPGERARGRLRDPRRRGHPLGMISVCSEEVERLWPETELGGLFDAEVFSCSAGVAKPDPRIYRACCEALGVEPRDAVFVGDGANDELAGARRVGMEAVLIHRPGEEPPWPELRGWDGPRIDALPQILELVRCG